MECKSLRESGTELKKFDIAYFGASCDTADKNKQFADKLEIDYPLLSDTDKKVATAYGILMRGRFSARNTIFVDIDGKIAHIESKVDVRSHGTQIVTKLKELKFPLKSDSTKNRPAEIKAFKAKLIDSISKAQDEDLAPLFDAADTDGNGTVDQAEIDALTDRMSKAVESGENEHGDKAESKETASAVVPDFTDIKCMFMDSNINQKFFVGFKEEKVYFCCWKCPSKFDPKNSEHIAAAEKQIALIKSRK